MHWDKVWGSGGVADNRLDHADIWPHWLAKKTRSKGGGRFWGGQDTPCSTQMPVSAYSNGRKRWLFFSSEEWVIFAAQRVQRSLEFLGPQARPIDVPKLGLSDTLFLSKSLNLARDLPSL